MSQNLKKRILWLDDLSDFNPVLLMEANILLRHYLKVIANQSYRGEIYTALGIKLVLEL